MNDNAGQQNPFRVAVIATVLNEERSIGELLESLVRQSRQPDEVIIVDGGSRDITVEIITSFSDRLPITLLVRPGLNISQGRNAAIAATACPVIASTDAGVRLEAAWLENLMRPFEQPESGRRTGVVCGFFLPLSHTAVELALGATILPRVGEIDPNRFLPSSRSVAFLREAWELWPYPEWLDYCEDLVFDIGLRQIGFPCIFEPAALVWFRPRTNLRAFFKQYYRYARGDGKANLWLRRHLIRYGTYLIILPALLYLCWGYSPWWLALMFVAGSGYLLQPYRRLIPDLAGKSLTEKAAAILLVPLIRILGDVAKMLGYPAGLVWRFRRRRDPAVHWRRKLARIAGERSIAPDGFDPGK